MNPSAAQEIVIGPDFQPCFVRSGQLLPGPTSRKTGYLGLQIVGPTPHNMSNTFLGLKIAFGGGLRAKHPQEGQGVQGAGAPSEKPISQTFPSILAVGPFKGGPVPWFPNSWPWKKLT